MNDMVTAVTDLVMEELGHQALLVLESCRSNSCCPVWIDGLRRQGIMRDFFVGGR